MTEEMLEQKIEEAADRFEKSITNKWGNRSFRFAFKSISVLAEIGLVIGSFALKENGYKTAWAWCFGLGVVGIAADVITSISFKKSKKK